uniref:Transmembrane protein 138 n=1 Tax=Saccoglossus kowalevskii TaxID=10224 RepID=A0ABM0N065_SACKO|nr:PREDICTED: transmembrane protein 138-like [Saccoglossus kowalevskii]
MHVGNYRIILYLQLFLLFVDLFVNSFSELMRISHVTLLVLFVIQDICIIFAAIVLFLMFFNTYVFQAGLVGLLIGKFKLAILMVFIYFMLCIGLHIWTMHHTGLDSLLSSLQTAWQYHPSALFYMWHHTGLDSLLSSLQTAWQYHPSAVFYYYYYKRTAYRLGDPRFYRDSVWLRKQFERRR